MTLINELYDNYKRYFRIAYKICKRPELAEEAIQATALKLVVIQTKVENPKRFISQAVFNQALNRERGQKKYDHSFKSIDIKSYYTPEVGLLQENNKALLLNEIELLPRVQKSALKSRFGLSDEPSLSSHYESNKTCYRLALLKLRATASKLDYHLEDLLDPVFVGTLHEK